MKKSYESEKVYKVMEGFATKEEIDEEIKELMEDGYSLDDAMKVLIANIDNWARWDNNDAKIVWHRMAELGIEVEPKYCTKN